MDFKQLFHDVRLWLTVYSRSCSCVDWEKMGDAIMAVPKSDDPEYSSMMTAVYRKVVSAVRPRKWPDGSFCHLR